LSSPPKISIILVNLNQEHHTRECLQSLQRLSYPNIEIILIDNGSIDDSGRKIYAEFPSIVYKHLEHNLGFAGGNNIGIQMALENNTEYVLLLNNDTVVDPGCLEPFIAYDQSHEKVGVQCGKIYYFSEPMKLWFAGGIYSVDKGSTTHRGMNETDAGRYDSIEETDFVTGCMMFIRRSVLENVGMLDDRLFAYFEDPDWCLRAKNMGYHIIYNPKSKIWHKVSVTSKVDSSIYLYLQMRNKILMVRKHSRGGRWLMQLPYFVYFFGRYFLRLMLKEHSPHKTHAVIAGIIDGLRNYTGENGKGRLSLFAPPGML
jgi:GT2 family glycosyltransferase